MSQPFPLYESISATPIEQYFRHLTLNPGTVIIHAAEGQTSGTESFDENSVDWAPSLILLYVAAATRELSMQERNHSFLCLSIISFRRSLVTMPREDYILCRQTCPAMFLGGLLQDHCARLDVFELAFTETQRTERTVEYFVGRT
jgi:hypothetical protein